MSQAAAARSEPDLVLGRYRPLRPLGSGGSGSVWLARDERSGREVALKVVRREGKADSRAEREAKAAAKLRHAGCQRAYAFGRDAEHVYIAYEYAPGKTLREALRAGELDDAAAIEAAAQILDALAHAHGHGIIHRDVKPSNVLLVDSDEVSIRLLDFGLARIEQAETLTAVGDVPGTLAYIAPERLHGHEATPASDVWAVGLLLYEALAGGHPFWRSSLEQTARAIKNGAPSLAQLRPDLPKPLAAAVDASLALDPARRPGAASLAARLRKDRRRGGRDGTNAAIATSALASRLLAGGLAGAYAGAAAVALPFYPAGWAIGLAALAAAAAFLRERVGLALALAVPVLPLGNVSLGLAFVYAGFAVAWLALSWAEPRSGLLFAAGAALAPVGALPLLPLLALRVRSPVRRAAQAAAGVLLAALAAGLRGAGLPFGGDPPLGLGIAGSNRPGAVAGALWHALLAHPQLGLEALALGVAAAALPYARARGPWGIAALGAALLAATALLAPSAPALPLVACAWATSLALVLEARR